jgi:hypothetical protein
MQNQGPDIRKIVVAAFAMALSALGAGCSGEEEAPAPVVVAPPPPPPVDPMANLKLHAKVQFPAERAPTTPELAQAVATLASALAKGDAAGAKAVLDGDASELIDAMVESGEWKTGTEGIEAVRVCVLSETSDATGATVGLGVQDEQGAYLLAWRGSAVDGVWRFEPMPLINTEAAQVALLDGSAMESRTLPAAESVNVDPESRRVKVRKMFSGNNNN